LPATDSALAAATWSGAQRITWHIRPTNLEQLKEYELHIPRESRPPY
jgi:hypothetical protein